MGKLLPKLSQKLNLRIQSIFQLRCVIKCRCFSWDYELTYFKYILMYIETNSVISKEGRMESISIFKLHFNPERNSDQAEHSLGAVQKGNRKSLLAYFQGDLINQTPTYQYVIEPISYSYNKRSAPETQIHFKRGKRMQKPTTYCVLTEYNMHRHVVLLMKNRIKDDTLKNIQREGKTTPNL